MWGGASKGATTAAAAEASGLSAHKNFGVFLPAAKIGVSFSCRFFFIILLLLFLFCFLGILTFFHLLPFVRILVIAISVFLVMS